MMQIAWYVGVTGTSLLLMASTALAQSFCSDLDGVIKLAPAGFRRILDDANRGAVETAVTRNLPGASACWYDNASGSYWCEWDVPSAQVENQVKELASVIGQCYDAQPESETTPASGEAFAFINLPNSISIYINGVADIVALSIGAVDKGRFDNSAGRSTGEGSQAPARLSPATNPLKDDVLGWPPDALAPSETLAPSPLSPLPARPSAEESAPEQRVYSSPEAGREVGGVRTPRDSPTFIPHSHGRAGR